ncbi:MAG: hypothetical protein ACAI25_10555 [Planctomycetota bacterium]
MDFRAQRYRDRLRAEGRSIAIRTARRTRDILDGYVNARRGGATAEPGTEVLWGRILVLVSGTAVGVYFLVQAIAKS